MPREFLEDENDLSTDELVARAAAELREEGDDTSLRSLIALHGRPTRTVVERSLALCRSSDAHDRILGLRILRELRHQLVDSARLWAPIEPTVVGLADREDNPVVLRWAISCLGYQSTSSVGVAAVLGRVNHPDSVVRLQVAAALPGMVDVDAPAAAAVAALMHLADDVDADVRAYALMGLTDDLELGSDTEVQTILERHVADPDEQIREHVRRVLAETANS